MIQIKEKDLNDAVTKAVLLMGQNPSVTELIKALEKQLSALFNKTGIEILIAKEEVKHNIGTTKSLEQRVSDLEELIKKMKK